MKTIILLVFLQLSCSAVGFGQGEQNVWVFGDGCGLDFNGGVPVNYANNHFTVSGGCASICDASGQLLFYTNGYWIWNRYHELMPQMTGGVSGYGQPIYPVGHPPLMGWSGGQVNQVAAITGVPLQPGRYYVFTLNTTGQLFYTVVDMSLDGGKGNIDPAKRSIPLASGLAEKLTVVKGCNNIWVMTRARNSNEYRAFEVNDTGIVAAPVVSNAGNLPVTWYRCGVIKFSADGSRMAAACHQGVGPAGGLELYQFNAMTGEVSQPLVLDSSSTAHYYGACFSPDGSKLYATQSFEEVNGVWQTSKVGQFDVSLSTPAAIAASSTIVYNDLVNHSENLGDLKRAPDGRIYFGSNKSPQTFLHRIDLPNVAGVGCNAVGYAMAINGAGTSRGLPNDVVVLSLPDTVRTRKDVQACFRDSVLVAADAGKDYRWDNSSTDSTRVIYKDGVYVVSYINANCSYQTDSISVHFMEAPVAGPPGYSCPGTKHGHLWLRNSNGDTSQFLYRWKDGGGNILREATSDKGDTLSRLDTGWYSVQVVGAGGCDTTLLLNVRALPVPVASFTTYSIVCSGVEIAFFNTSSAPSWKWDLGKGWLSMEQHPVHTYNKRGFYKAGLSVTNIEGCSDTLYKEIEVKDLEMNLTADKVLVKKGEAVYLQSSGSGPYTVTSWEPAQYFSNPILFAQQVIMDTTRMFVVTGVTPEGCVASARVEVAVHPLVFMPSGFSPNGDGLNDRFRPLSTGYIIVRFFEVYNRFGEMVFNGQGRSSIDGWDGSFKGEMQDIGTYFYRINIETREGKTVEMKGEVTLVK